MRITTITYSRTQSIRTSTVKQSGPPTPDLRSFPSHSFELTAELDPDDDVAGEYTRLVHLVRHGLDIAEFEAEFSEQYDKFADAMSQIEKALATAKATNEEKLDGSREA